MVKILHIQAFPACVFGSDQFSEPGFSHTTVLTMRAFVDKEDTGDTLRSALSTKNTVLLAPYSVACAYFFFSMLTAISFIAAPFCTTFDVSSFSFSGEVRWLTFLIFPLYQCWCFV